MKRARIGIVGVGWWGTVGHLVPLADDPKADVVAVWSRTAAKAEARAREYGVPRAYSDWQKMMDEGELDGVIVASTPNMHFPQAHYALERGLHVLVEKPFAVQADHADALHHLANQRGLMLSVCHPMLFHPPVLEAREAIRRGALGKVGLVSAHFSQRVYELLQGDAPTYTHPRAQDGGRVGPNAASYSQPEVAGGGEGHAQASHIVGAVLWLLEQRPQTVYAMMENAAAPLDVTDALTVRFSGGALGAITANGLVARGPFLSDIMIQGDAATMLLSAGPASAPATCADGAVIAYPLPTREEYREAIPLVPRNFVRAILGEEELRVSAQCAADEARLLAAAYRSVETGVPSSVQLPD